MWQSEPQTIHLQRNIDGLSPFNTTYQVFYTTCLNWLDRLNIWVINMSMNKNDGFTLIELLITLAIAGVLLTVATPSFTRMIQNNRQVTQINSLVGTFNLARSEAVKRGVNVVVCRSADRATCASSGGWEQGWLIFVDANGDNAVDTGNPTDEPVLRIWNALDGGNTLTPNNNFTNRVVYQANGFSTTFGTFVLCDDRDKDGDVVDGDDFTNGHAVMINRTGRARSDDASNSNFTNCTG